MTKKELNGYDMFKIIPKDNFSQILLLVIFGLIMFFLRTAPIHHLVFTDWPGVYGKFVNFAADDAVYHMRLVHNTIHHFPWRVFFDPFTHFPFGNQIHFGPLFSLIIVATSLIAGLGHPTPELINIVGAYIPPVMGVISLVPAYFIARELCGKTAAIITAFILTFLPGEFLQRSTLGYVDHHVAEVLFSTLTCVFLIYALNATKNRKNFLIYSLLAGIAFGLFVLTWPAALMFGVIFLTFFITQLVIDHCNNNNTEYLLLLAVTIYSISALMVLPYALVNPHLELTYYSLTQPLILIGMAAVFTICYAVHLLFKRNYFKDWYSLGLLALCALTVFILHRYAPNLYLVIQDGCKLLFEPNPGMRTISEVRSSLLNPADNKFTIMVFWYAYYWTMPLALIGLGYLYYRSYKNPKPAEVLLLIWTLAMILAACAQCRFNYYLAINVAIIAGCYGFYPFMNLLTKLKQKTAPHLFFCLFAFFITEPILLLLLNNNITSGPHVPRERYNTFMWLKNHTPDPQGEIINKDFDYTAGYYPISKNPHSPYPYPTSAYGIMAWWDIGHQLTYIAERIPNSNPFQLGIIESDKTIGAALFFTSTDEKNSIKNLDAMGSRYILIDYDNTVDLKGIGIWLSDTENWTTTTKIKIATPTQPATVAVPIDSGKFSHSMTYRLFYADANELQHFRLIHESDGDYALGIKQGIFNKSKFHVDKTTLYFKNHDQALKKAAAINPILWLDKEQSTFAYATRPPVKPTKIFEKVAGATISGKVSEKIADNTAVNLTIKLKTKFDRIFVYHQSTKVQNGKYEFVVPYPTTPMRGENYSYDIEPQGSYQIQIGATKIAVTVPENAVMVGKRITISDKI